MYMANIVHLGTRITKIVDVKLSKLKFFFLLSLQLQKLAILLQRYMFFINIYFFVFIVDWYKGCEQ